jgi:Arc/MetJ-type ribon-helix-helix transcriptional regulator
MNLTVKFTGHVADVIDELVGRGVAATKSEALRLGVLKLEEQYLRGGEAEFDRRATIDAVRQDRLIKEGKLKLHTQAEFDARLKKLKEK